jgi:hypothetical protein
MEVLTGVRKSWLRRLAVRCLEWRRFGLGIAVPFQMASGADQIAAAALIRKSLVPRVKAVSRGLKSHSPGESEVDGLKPIPI